MTEQHTPDQVAAAAAAFAGGDVTYHPATPVQLPPPAESEPTVTIALRVPASLAQRTRRAAETQAITLSELVRGWMEMGLTELDAPDKTVSLAELRRAIAHAAQSTRAA
ncbi:hypothetical protein [Actinoplanes sp. NPDC051851]|uniref:hypothetical protein n=1 Tax=Actinoplanes sp. NPDC051851 TaxID=3154753 RepID=UPI00341508C0